MTITRTCSLPDCTRPHKGHGYCDLHLQRVKKHNDAEKGKRPPSTDRGNGMRFCDYCQEVLPETYFYQHPTRLYFERRCRSCDKIRNRLNHVKRMYGEAGAAFEEKLINGEGCEICGLHKDDLMAIDHDHATGIPVGILCRNCNSAIGQLGDSVEMLTKALEYVKRTR